ncbi:hypothetical protein ABEV74_01585, partial [Paenibacillus cisolokensis]|uniref:hypothetical protein n=1 Tax=Paenibacillus cisolokensis TaxID=1658519 RepID=UPI003D2D7EC9
KLLDTTAKSVGQGQKSCTFAVFRASAVTGGGSPLPFTKERLLFPKTKKRGQSPGHSRPLGIVPCFFLLTTFRLRL